MNHPRWKVGTSLIGHVAGDRLLPPRLQDEIAAKTDGIPLFVEELTKAVLDSDAEPEDQKSARSAHGGISLPQTLHDSLMARLDHLGATKEIAQIGSVIGREFQLELVRAVTNRDEATILASLGELVRSELVIPRGQPPNASYRFKHALVQDAAYQSLLRNRRETIHGQIANLLTASGSDRAEIEPELVAYHFTRSSTASAAIPYWLRAGRRAIEQSASRECISHARMALELLEALPDTAERDRIELEAQGLLAPAYVATAGQAAPEVDRSARRARELALKLGDSADLVPLWFSWMFNETRANHETAVLIAREMREGAERGLDRQTRMISDAALGVSLFHTCKLQESISHLDDAISEYARDNRPRRDLWYGVDLGAAAYAYRAWGRWMLGYPDSALEDGQKLLEVVNQGEHRYTYSRGFYWNAVLHQLRGEPELVAERAEMSIRAAATHDFAMSLPAGRIMRAWARSQIEREDAVAEIRECLRLYASTGARMHLIYLHTLLISSLQALGKVEAALDVVGEALQLVQTTGERYFEAEVERLHGDLILVAGSAGRSVAEGCYKRGLSVARAQGARSLELRLATSLSRVWAETGERQKALDLLAPLLDWFTQGSGTRDLSQARELCGELSRG